MEQKSKKVRLNNRNFKRMKHLEKSLGIDKRWFGIEHNQVKNLKPYLKVWEVSQDQEKFISFDNGKISSSRVEVLAEPTFYAELLVGDKKHLFGNIDKLTLWLLRRLETAGKSEDYVEKRELLLQLLGFVTV